MKTEEEKSMERIYKHFGFTGENIETQKQVSTDIYNILKNMGFKPQTPDCISIDTKNKIHYICVGYPFDFPNTYGFYRYNIPSFEIRTDYKFEELQKFIKNEVYKLYINDLKKWEQVQALFEEE